MPLLRLLALSLLFAVAVPALAEAQTVDLRRKISVNGQSSALVANDAARLTLGVTATRPTAKGALDAASRRMQRVIGSVEGRRRGGGRHPHADDLGQPARHPAEGRAHAQPRLSRDAEHPRRRARHRPRPA